MYQRTNSRGVGGYKNSGDWTWEHYPPPYDQWAPSDSVAQPALILGGRGMGCSAGCGCGGNSIDQGLGYFTSMDPSTWGIEEWATVAGVGYIALKVLGSHQAVRKTRKSAGKAGSSAISGLGTIVVWGAVAYGAYYLYNQYQSGGLGDYQPQGWATPQFLSDPTRNSNLQIPAGW